MRSVFDPQIQNKDIDAKITAALERLSQTFRISLWDENKKHHLSPIQLQIITFILFHPSRFCTVSRLAEEFNLTKPTISDAVRVLREKSILKQTSDPADKRTITLALTAKGQKIARDASLYATDVKEEIAHLPEEHKTILMRSLMDTISRLQQRGAISVARMCLTCQYFEKGASGENKHYCGSLKIPLKETDLRVDCPQYAPQTS